MKTKVKMQRIGRYSVDVELLNEGYELEDICDEDDPVIELPELFDPEKRRYVGWIICPECGEKSQVDRRDPNCSFCGWNEDVIRIKRPMKCAA